MRRSVVVAALASVLAGTGCKRTNPAYCDDATPCPSGMACDLVARECYVLSGGGGRDMTAVNIDMAGCTCSSTTPICVAMTCVSCLSTSDPDGACASASPSAPFCLTTGGDAGSCVGCRDSTDCSGAASFCDSGTHTCRGCLSDLECPSLVCDLTPTSATRGICVAMNQIEYVDGTASTNGNGLTPTTPRQKLQDAVMHATGADNRPYVRVAATSYDENVSVSNGAVISIVGADGAIVSPSSNDAVSAFNGASMTIRNLIVTAANGNGGNCQNASFTAYRSQFIKSKQSGVYSLNCDLNIDATWLDSNGEGGIYIGGGNFQVTNSIITRNVSSGGLYQLASGATTTFVNNTVADNSAGGSVGGVFCSTMSSLVLRNSIFASNAGGGGTGVVETNCPTSSSASDDPTGGPQSAVDLTTMPPGFKRSTPTTADSYHLLPTSPCVNNASLVYAPNHDFDFETRPDPTTMQPDIGADEVE